MVKQIWENEVTLGMVNDQVNSMKAKHKTNGPRVRQSSVKGSVDL